VAVKAVLNSPNVPMKNAVQPIIARRGFIKAFNLLSTIWKPPFFDELFADLVDRPARNPAFKPLRKIKEQRTTT